MLSEAQQKITEQERRGKVDIALTADVNTSMPVNRLDEKHNHNTLSKKQMIINEQARRIMALDDANSRLHSALTDIQEGFHIKNNGMITKINLTMAEVGQFKTSSC